MKAKNNILIALIVVLLLGIFFIAIIIPGKTITGNAILATGNAVADIPLLSSLFSFISGFADLKTGMAIERMAESEVISYGNPKIVNHTAVDEFDYIPKYYLNEAKKMRLNILGESHSTGYMRGLSILNQMNPKYPSISPVSGISSSYREDALRADKARRTIYGWGNGAGEREWYANSSLRDSIKFTIDYSNQNDYSISAIAFGWCWDMTWHNLPGGDVDPVYNVRWAGASEGGPEGDMRWGLDADDTSLTGNSISMDTYLSATQDYEDYCLSKGYDTKVIFTTGPVDGGGNTGENGYQRYLKHEYIRNYTKNHNNWLFDYADILTHNSSGEQRIISWNGNAFPAIHSDNMRDYDDSWNLISHTEDGDHIGEVGAVRLAKAQWVLAARLAGWDGTPKCSAGSCGQGMTCNLETELCESTGINYEGFQTNLSQYGITWFFDKNLTTNGAQGTYQYGTFVNGDYWVVNPDESSLGYPKVTVVGISPASFVNDEGVTMHGSMINPMFETQGYRSQDWTSNIFPHYSAELNVAFGLSRSNPSTWLNLAPNSSLVSSITKRHEELEGDHHNCALKSASVLTVLGQAPPNVNGKNTYFRPSFNGKDKTLYDSDVLNHAGKGYGLLMSLDPAGVANIPNPEELAKKLRRPWIDHWSSAGVQNIRCSDYMGCYGTDYFPDIGDAEALIHLDFSKLPGKPSKENLTIGIVQRGIDLAGLLKDVKEQLKANTLEHDTWGGVPWMMDGGKGAGKKWSVLLAGLLLGEKGIISLANNTISNINEFSTDTLYFGEDNSVFYVTDYEVSVAPYGEDFTTYDKGIPHYSKMRWPSSLYPRNVGSSPNTGRIWGEAGYQRCCHSQYFAGWTLSALLTDLGRTWNNKAYFDYVDRYMQIEQIIEDNNNRYLGNTYGYPTRQSSSFEESLWDKYRSTIGCVWELDNDNSYYGHYNCNGELYNCKWQGWDQTQYDGCASCITINSCQDYQGTRAKEYDPCNLGCNESHEIQPCLNTDTSCGTLSCQDCNSLDGCYSTDYRDYRCSNNACTYSVAPNHPGCQQPNCITSSGSWQNSIIPSQTAPFIAIFNATPNANNIDAVIGVSNGDASAYANLVANIRFNSTGFIDVRNGTTYSPSTVHYTSGITYEFKLAIDVPGQRFDVYITPQGQNEILLGVNFAFRATSVQLNRWVLISPDSISVCGFSTVTGSCPTPSRSCGSSSCTGTQPCSNGVWSPCSTANTDCGVCCTCDINGNPSADLTQDNDCHANNRSVARCDYTPDSYYPTYDFYPSFASECTAINTCTALETGWEDDITHTCNKLTCGAVCQSEETQTQNTYYCKNNDRYRHVFECNSSCLFSSNDLTNDLFVADCNNSCYIDSCLGPKWRDFNNNIDSCLNGICAIAPQNCTTPTTSLCNKSRCGAACDSSNPCLGAQTCDSNCQCSGQQCTENSHCQSNQFCDNTGSCVTKISNGQACAISGYSSLNHSCISGICNSDYTGNNYCVSYANNCTHLGIEYQNNAQAPDCFNSTAKRSCSNGNWITTACQKQWTDYISTCGWQFTDDSCIQGACDIGIDSQTQCNPYNAYLNNTGCYYGLISQCNKSCGATCSANSDCKPTECNTFDGCVDPNGQTSNDYYDYHNMSNSCKNNCACETNSCTSITITQNDPRCLDKDTDGILNYLDCNDISPSIGECDGCRKCSEIPTLTTNEGTCILRTKEANINKYGCPLPKSTKFQNLLSTNLSDANLADTKVILALTQGSIDFENNLTLVRLEDDNYTSLDLDANIDISQGKISLNASALPELNYSAYLTFTNLGYSRYKVLKDGIQTVVSELQPPAAGNSYTLKIWVPSFSTYEIIQDMSCGDGFCNNDESCSTCPADCSTCSIPPSGGGGGGGGGGGSTPEELTLTNKWQQSSLKVFQKVSFTYKKEKHTLYVDKIEQDTVYLSIYSKKISLSLKTSEWKSVDITEDEVPDIDVKYDGKVSVKATISLKESEVKNIVPITVIEEKKTSESALEETKEDKTAIENTSAEEFSPEERQGYAAYWFILLVALGAVPIIFLSVVQLTKHIHHHLLTWKYFKVASKVREEKVDLHKELDSYKYKELKAYIQECLKWHYPKERIIKACISVGWEKDIVEEAVKEAE